MPIAPPPVIVPDKCIFYLDGTKERTGKWKLAQIRGVNIVDERYTSPSNNGLLQFNAKRKIKNTTGVYSASLFVKRNVVGNGHYYEEFGFYFNYNTSNDCGYMGNSLFIDDSSTTYYANITDVSSIISGKELEPLFITLCKDNNGTTYVTLDGKLIYTTKNLKSDVNPIDTIRLFDADDSSTITGWIDKVVIHKGICLYKEDFDVLPMDQYPEYKYTEDDNSLKLY